MRSMTEGGLALSLPAPRGEVAAQQTEGCLFLVIGSLYRHEKKYQDTPPSHFVRHLPAGRREEQPSHGATSPRRPGAMLVASSIPACLRSYKATKTKT